MTDNAPVSFTQTRRPKVYLLGAGKNARAPARGGKSNGLGSAAVLGRINPMTDRTTGFGHANRTTEHSPAGGGQECPRSCTRWKKQRRSGARPSPAASTRRPIVRPVSGTQIGRPNIHRLDAAKNRRAPARGGKSNGARERGWPRPHQPDDRSYDRFRSHESDDRTFTGWGWARMPALLQGAENSNDFGSAAKFVFRMLRFNGRLRAWHVILGFLLSHSQRILGFTIRLWAS